MIESMKSLETQFLIPADWILTNDLCQNLCVVLEFFVKQRWFHCILWPNVLPKLGKITLTCPKSAKVKEEVQFWLAQRHQNDYQLWTASSQENGQFKNLYISSHVEARKPRFGQKVNLIQRFPLSTRPQKLVTSLLHNHVTNLFISSYRGATVIKLGRQKQLFDRSPYGTFPFGVVTSLHFDHLAWINLHISS